jgi:hypothetical protein
MFWYNKELSWNDRILQMVKDQTNTFVKLTQAFILSHTIEILALTTVIIILTIIIKQIWRGRLGYQTIMDQKEEGKTINIANNITTTLNTTGGNMGNSKCKNGKTLDQQALIHPPQKLDENTHIPTWLEAIESYVHNEEDEDKYRVTLSYITNEILKKINIISKNKSTSENINRFENLKEQLLKLDENHLNQQIEEEEISLKAMADRTQQMHESITEFGTALTNIARKLLPTVDMHSLAEILKKQFIDGLQNKDVAEKVMLKLYEKKSKNKNLSVKETIELAKHIENAHIVTKKLSKKDDIGDNSSLCMIDNVKQDPIYNNSNNNNCSNINNSSTQSFDNNNRNNFKNLQPKQNHHLVQAYQNNNQKTYNNGRQSEQNDSKSNNRANYNC